MAFTVLCRLHVPYRLITPLSECHRTYDIELFRTGPLNPEKTLPSSRPWLMYPDCIPVQYILLKCNHTEARRVSDMDSGRQSCSVGCVLKYLALRICGLCTMVRYLHCMSQDCTVCPVPVVNKELFLKKKWRVTTWFPWLPVTSDLGWHD